jgi:hypothetical protein
VPEQAKRILSFDGGGVRGLVSIAILERLEAEIARQTGVAEVHLCDHFDLIGGTSTGALIASALALGMRASELRDHYFRIVPRIFRSSPFRIFGLYSRFNGERLAQELRAIAGERTLDSPDLRTGFAVVMKRIDSGSVWVVSSSPRAPYYEDPPDGHFVGNKHYRLADLVRASTAAPHYFQPQPIQLFPKEAPGLFVDGAVTPYGNPALLMLMVAHLEPYGWGWPLGAERLKLVSIGTGSFRHRVTHRQLRYLPALGLAVKTLLAMSQDCSQQALTILQWLGRSETPYKVNSELGDLSTLAKPADPLFSFWRWDAQLEAEWLERHLGRSFAPRALGRLRRMDAAENARLAYEIGQAAGEAQVTAKSVARLLS